MAKKPSDTLFRLIKSLTKAEKGYFRKYSSLHNLDGKKDYIRVFDAINAQKEYDEAKIREKFAGMSIAKRFPVLKNYLQQAILKSMRHFHEHDNVTKQAKTLLHDAQFLLEKTLYRESWKIVQKAKKLCVIHDLFNLWIELLYLEIKLVGTGVAGEFDYRTFADVIDEQKEVYLSGVQLHELNEVLVKIWLISNQYSPPSGESDPVKAMDRLLNHPVMKLDPKTLSKRERMVRNSAYSIYYYGLKQPEKRYAYERETIDIFEESEAFWKAEHLNYYKALFNFTDLCIDLGKIDEAMEVLAHVDAIDIKVPPFIQILRTEITYSQALTSGVFSGEFEKVVALTDEVEEILERHSKALRFSFRAMVYLHLAHGYYAIKDYKKALLYLTRLLDLEQKKDIYSTQMTGKYLILIIHFELENYDLLPNLIRSTQRFIVEDHPFETALIRFFKDLLKLKDPQELKDRYLAMQAELHQIRKSGKRQIPQEHFSFERWLESRIHKVSFAEAVQAHHKTLD